MRFSAGYVAVRGLPTPHRPRNGLGSHLSAQRTCATLLPCNRGPAVNRASGVDGRNVRSVVVSSWSWRYHATAINLCRSAGYSFGALSRLGFGEVVGEFGGGLVDLVEDVEQRLLALEADAVDELSVRLVGWRVSSRPGVLARPG